MPTGYLVTLGDISLDAGDSVIDPATGFTTTAAIGSGTVTWTGTTPGFWPWSPPTNHTNEVAAGQYHEATDGNVYFVPDAGTNATITSASVTTAPAYSSGDGVLTGTAGDDVIDASFVDEDGEQVDAGDGTGPSGNEDLIRAGDGNDTIASGAGDDTVYGGAGSDTIDGGTGNDTIHGDQDAESHAESMNWDAVGADASDLSAGFTQNTGDMDVTVSFSDDGNNNASYAVESTDTIYVAGGEDFNTTSSGQLWGNGDAATSTTDISFAGVAGSGASDEVQNVSFRISDIDWDNGNHTDIVTVNAFDAAGNPVTVTITPGSTDTVTGNTISAGTTSENASDEGGSALIEIAGPVSSIEIIYSNGQDGTQAVWVSDVHFDTIPADTDGDDTIDGGAGDDIIYGDGGDDTIDGGAGNDVIYGDTGPGGAESLNWDNEGGDGSNIAAGFTQDTGEMDVTVAFSDDGNNNATFNVETTDVNYVVAGEPYNTTSSVSLFGNGDAATSTTTIDFAASAGSSASDDVQNVQFRISDIDWASGDFRDQVTIRAYDANGNEVHVNITESSNDTLSGNTITGGDVAEGTADEGGSALIEIAGPVSSITVAYGNMGTGTQAIRITDVHFDTIVDTSDGNDTIDGGAGDDIIYGQDGDDTIAGGLGLDEMSGGDGNDTIEVAQGDSAYGGDGDDTFNVVDLNETGSGSINIVGGEGGETDGDTLNWAGVADKDSLVITNDDDADGGLSGSFTMLDGTVVTFSEIENIVCFASTTGILTPHGTRPIEDLKAGDFVITRDNGLQAIRWIGKRTVPALNKFAPICFAAGSLPNLERPLLVSPQHRMLVGNHLSELYLGESEVLVSAKHMLNDTSITRKVGGEVTYMHMLFDRHEIIYADGTASESFHPGDIGLDAVSDAARSEMFSLFPHLRTDPQHYGSTARKCLRKHEALMVA